MKEAVAEALDTFTLEDYQRVFKKWLEHYNKCIELRGPALRVTEVSCFYEIINCLYCKSLKASGVNLVYAIFFHRQIVLFSGSVACETGACVSYGINVAQRTCLSTTPPFFQHGSPPP